jgi:hypothetical protein
MSGVVYLGPVAPEAYVVDVVPGTSGVDLSTVTDAALLVLRPDGAEVVWSVTRSNQTASTLTLTHVFEATDVDVVGEYGVYAAMTIPAGTVRSEPRSFPGLGRFDTT